MTEIFVMKNSKGYWLTEFFTPTEKHSHLIKKFLVKKQTRFQKAILADSYSFKRCLVLDGEMQSAEFDEFIYHESLVHPPMMFLEGQAREILIMGGGEGATARELLKYKSVSRITMVDIDGEVVDFAKKYLTGWHKGSFHNKKVEVVIDDAKKYIEDSPDGKFDLIISDLPTPIEGGPAYLLYTLEFYKTLKKKLKPGGVFAAQAGSGNLLQYKFHSMLCATLKKIFGEVMPYYAYVPSFDVPWAFLIATDLDRKKIHLSAGQVDSILNRSFNKKQNLRFYDGLTHEGLFAIPKLYRDILRNEKRIISSRRPVFFFK